MKLAISNIILFSFFFTSVNAQTDNSQLTYKNFKDSLRKEMNYNAVVNAFGKPDKDIGSGIYILVYTLKDSTHMLIGCAHKIFYARHLDKEQKLINTLIEDKL